MLVAATLGAEGPVEEALGFLGATVITVTTAEAAAARLAAADVKLLKPVDPFGRGQLRVDFPTPRYARVANVCSMASSGKLRSAARRIFVIPRLPLGGHSQGPVLALLLRPMAQTERTIGAGDVVELIGSTLPTRGTVGAIVGQGTAASVRWEPISGRELGGKTRTYPLIRLRRIS